MADHTHDPDLEIKAARSARRPISRATVALGFVGALAVSFAALDPLGWIHRPTLDVYRAPAVELAAAPISPGLTPRPCWFDLPAPESVEVRCATHVTRQIPDDPSSTLIARGLVLLTPPNYKAAPPLVYLAGGPGYAAATETALEATLPMLGDVARRAGQRLIVSEYRGAGASAPAVDCPAYRAVLRDGGYTVTGNRERRKNAVIRDCLDALKRADVAPSFYATRYAAADLEALRRDLEAPQLSLWGASYGGVLAQDYAARHPDKTYAVILDSSPPADRLELGARFDPQAAADVLEASCRASPRCDEAAFWRHLTGLFNDGPPLRVTTAEPIDEPGFAPVAPIYNLYGPQLVFGAVFWAAYRERREGLADMLLDFDPQDPATHAWLARQNAELALEYDFSPLLYRLVRCNDGAPRPSGGGSGPAVQRYILPRDFELFDGIQTMDCAAIGLSTPSLVFKRLDPETAPRMLIFVGGLDVLVPPDSVGPILERNPNPTLHRIAGAGHGILSDPLYLCARDAVADFLNGGSGALAC